ncbi:hypothetical protein EON82_00870 [bacterium]|nr:MAG: hypothetical protein EON82_00870 [bacterium]
MAERTPGRLEFEFLSYLAERGPSTSREIHEGFGVPRGYVRGTVVKAIDRLLKKGRVLREQRDGLFSYSVAPDAIQTERDLVESFVKERLKGRIAPLVAYFSESEKLDAGQIEELKAMIDRLEQDRG